MYFSFVGKYKKKKLTNFDANNFIVQEKVA